MSWQYFSAQNWRINQRHTANYEEEVKRLKDLPIRRTLRRSAHQMKYWKSLPVPTSGPNHHYHNARYWLDQLDTCMRGGCIYVSPFEAWEAAVNHTAGTTFEATTALMIRTFIPNMPLLSDKILVPYYSIHMPALHYAAAVGDIPYLELFAKLNPKKFKQVCTGYSAKSRPGILTQRKYRTPLHTAITHQQLEVVKYLSVFVNYASNYVVCSDTPWGLALHECKWSVIKLIVESPTDTSMRDLLGPYCRECNCIVKLLPDRLPDTNDDRAWRLLIKSITNRMINYTSQVSLTWK